MPRTYRHVNINVVLEFDDTVVRETKHNWAGAYECATMLKALHATSLRRAARWVIFFELQSKINHDGSATNGNGGAH
jgi:hypothetical protein